MHVDLLFDPFGARWDDVHEGALAARDAGFDAVWLYDHLAGSVHRAPDVLECWTTLTAIAASVPTIGVGPMVLNVANRDPGTLAVMAATLQHVSGGRLLLGIGAGGGHGTPYADEQFALGRAVPGDRRRRAAVEQAITKLRAVWSGTVNGVAGFLRPEPAPPVIVGGFGPKMAQLAGRAGDGMNVPAGPNLRHLIDVARVSRERAGRDPNDFIVTTSAGPRDREPLAELGVARMLLFVARPFRDNVARAHDALSKSG